MSAIIIASLVCAALGAILFEIQNNWHAFTWAAIAAMWMFSCYIKDKNIALIEDSRDSARIEAKELARLVERQDRAVSDATDVIRSLRKELNRRPVNFTTPNEFIPQNFK
jgi:hypothetical protein